jgi:hypothetical protein
LGWRGWPIRGNNLESFTVRQYARDMGIPESTAWNAVTKGVQRGAFIKTDKIMSHGRLRQRYKFAGEDEQFVMPKTCFWNDPFNKTRKSK